jgi:hypothetical protein
MSSCSYCNSIILWGGRQIGAFKFCNDKCAIKGTRALAAQQIPDDVVIPFVRRLHSGPCPKCGGPGPVDVFTAYSIWSAVVVTRWVSEPQVSCKPCGVKHQAVSLGKSLVLGWWGFPWGLIITPIQIVRNVIGLSKSPDPFQPSAALQQIARLQLAAQRPAAK